MPLISGVVRALNDGEAQHHRLIELDLIDVLRIDLDLDQKIVALRHDQHDRIAGGDDAADRIRGRLEHGAVLRRADIGALELILGGDLALDIFADLAVGLAQLLGDVARQILIDLDDLQLDLGDLALGLGGLSDELAALAFDLGLVALQRGEPVELDQILLPQLAHALQFLLDQAELLVLRAELSGRAR